MSVNKIEFIGNLGRDPETRTTPSGKQVTSFNVAVNREWTDDSGQKNTVVTWYRVSVWNNQARACAQYLHKGSKVFVEGRIDPDPATGGPRIYEKKDGSGWGAFFEITASHVEFLSSKGDESDGGSVEDVPNEDADFMDSHPAPAQTQGYARPAAAVKQPVQKPQPMPAAPRQEVKPIKQGGRPF